ncbi:MAG: hypothetical protein JO056_12605 [Alphaproteobacteria bacterium]|nr:hypothetical protein [Alphaproteobacteria bacterium]
MRIAYLIPAFAAAALLGGTTLVSATNFTTLHQFCRQLPCVDGAGPLESPLTPDGAGNFFGTTQNFGEANGGTLYALIGGSKYKKLFDFPSVAAPRGPLVRDANGNLYGIEGNGASGNGGIFKLTPQNKKLTKWTFETLYTFCPGGGDCPDGATPVMLTYEGAGAGLPYDGTSPLYGSTVFGGGAANSGTVFQLAPKGGSWKEKVLYSFCVDANCTDGEWPAYGLVPGAKGVLYGVTTSGGAAGQGVVFRLKPNAKRSKWKESTVYSLCAAANCTDGANGAGLALDGGGNLVVTASSGGDAGRGTLFRVTPGGSFTRLYSFCQQENCADGSTPLAGPTVAPDGTIYGVTSLDARVFSFVPAGSAYTVLHTFCTDKKCADGFEPLSPLTIDAGGRLLGTTAFGGSKHSGGTVFSLTP